MPANTTNAILIKIKDPNLLARSQGATASFVTSLAPATVENKVLSEIARQLKTALQEQNVEADVAVVQPALFKDAGISHVASDIGLAVGGMGLAGLAWWLMKRGKRK